MPATYKKRQLTIRQQSLILRYYREFKTPLNFVFKVMRRQVYKAFALGITEDQLLDAANDGLVCAAFLYRPGMGTKYASFANNHILEFSIPRLILSVQQGPCVKHGGGRCHVSGDWTDGSTGLTVFQSVASHDLGPVQQAILNEDACHARRLMDRVVVPSQREAIKHYFGFVSCKRKPNTTKRNAMLAIDYIRLNEGITIGGIA